MAEAVAFESMSVGHRGSLQEGGQMLDAAASRIDANLVHIFMPSKLSYLSKYSLLPRLPSNHKLDPQLASSAMGTIAFGAGNCGFQAGMIQGSAHAEIHNHYPLAGMVKRC